MLTGPFTRTNRTGAEDGVSLVELLVATVIAGVALCSAWSWLWSTGVASSATVDRARASTAASFAARAVTEELELATGLREPPAAYSAGGALSMSHTHPDQALETVLVVWDPTRRVLWRKAPGTYLADHVERFTVSYLDRRGHLLSTADLQNAEWPDRVSRVEAEIVVSAGRSSATAVCDVTLGQR
jgi:prepilin-type N-terminal cleavage/methylation domain-containing protein